MTDDRRERYAAAILAAGNGEPVGPRAAADAAMTVADEEIRRTGELLREASSTQLAEQQAAYQALARRAAEWVEENARLRTELESGRTRWKAGLQRADESVREMNAEIRRYATGEEAPVMWSVYNRMHLRAANAEATIARVQEDCTRLAPNQPDPVEQAVAYGEGWNAALDMVQRTLDAHYVRFENDGHPEDSEAAADEAMAIVQPELEEMTKTAKANHGLHSAAHDEAVRHAAAIERVRTLAADMRTWCSPHGIATDYAQRIEDAINGPEVER